MKVLSLPPSLPLFFFLLCTQGPSNGKGVKPSHRGNKRVKVVRCLDSSSSNSGDDSKSGVVAAVDEQEVRSVS